ncbi:Diphthamide biosynthesis protein 2 [Coemansia sp. Benny D115]|nr:Diphthamide biosynthesis protein 2 [Coemansia sp. Benny D115]
MSALGNDGSSAIQRDVEGSSSRPAIDAHSALVVYRVARTAEVISAGGYAMVALQFPDNLLIDSTVVSSELQKLVGPECKIFILADTSFGSCCVDEVAAEHYSADIVIHYGRTCLSLTSRLPVFYVFGQEEVDVEDCVEQATRELVGQDLLLMYDVPFAYRAEEIAEALRSRVDGDAGSRIFGDVVLSRISAADRVFVPRNNKPVASSGSKSCGSGDGGAKSECCGGCNGGETQRSALLRSTGDSVSEAVDHRDNPSAGRSWDLGPEKAIGDYTILYIGAESPTLTNIMVTLRARAVFSYDPSAKTLREESSKVNRHLNKRYFAVQRAKDADIIGIVVGTLAATRYVRVIEMLKQMIRKAQKKLYVFVVGKLSMAKLGNFTEIEAFVLVACPENSLVDGKDFDKPIVTPYEFMLAISRTREWTGDYITDFHDFLKEAENESQKEQQNAPASESGDDSDSPHFSLITGGLKQRRRYAAPVSTAASEVGVRDLILRNDKYEIAKYLGSAGAEYLLSRSFRGLGHDDNLDETSEPMIAVDGRSGIARGYTAGDQESRV